MTSWSYSHYSLALQCLRKYKYIVIDKLVSNVPDSSDLVFGSAIHSAINSVLLGEDGQAVFEMYWNSYKDKDISYGRFNWQQLAELGSGFIRKFTKYHVGKYKLEFAEQRLYGSYKGINLEGTLDYYGVYQGRASLRDFKTSGRNYESGKQDCALQLYLYAFLYLRNNPGAKIETLAYVIFNKGTGSIQNLEWEFSEKEMYWHLDNLVAYVKLLNTEEYPRNVNACLEYNRKCQFWGACHGKDSPNAE